MMFIQELLSDPRLFLAVCITVIVSICLHELAHGIVAILHGDRTPIETGHMTLNPAAHITPVSIICLLVAGIAWGSMPVDPRRLRGRYGSALVAAAGPASNILLAILAIAAVGLWQRFDPRATAELPRQAQNFQYLLWVFGIVNMHLALFNLVPIPPLDGSRVLANFSHRYAAAMRALESSGAVITMYLLLFCVAGALTAPLAPRIATQLLHVIRGH